MAVIGWLALYFWQVMFVTVDNQEPYAFTMRIINCLNPNIAMSFGIRLIGQYETQCMFASSVCSLCTIINMV